MGVHAATMMAGHEDVWDRNAAQSYDTPGTGMFAPDVLDPVVDRLVALAGPGGALLSLPSSPGGLRSRCALVARP